MRLLVTEASWQSGNTGSSSASHQSVSHPKRSNLHTHTSSHDTKRDPIGRSQHFPLNASAHMHNHLLYLVERVFGELAALVAVLSDKVSAMTPSSPLITRIPPCTWAVRSFATHKQPDRQNRDGHHRVGGFYDQCDDV